MDCRIRVDGHLDPSWQKWLADLAITHQLDRGKGTTMLSGHLRDQAELYGVLLTIRRLGLSLLFLETSEVPLDQKPGGSSQ